MIPANVDAKTMPIFVRAEHHNPEHEEFFRRVAPTKQEIKQATDRIVLACTECNRTEVDLGASLRRCKNCKSVWYCSRQCQKMNWPRHKTACGPEVKGSGILKLVEKIMANNIILFYLQMILIFEFDLLRNRSVDKPLMERIDIGVEPSNIVNFAKLLYGEDVGTDIEGMLQINIISPDKTGTPLTPTRMEMWRSKKKEMRDAGSASIPVAIIEFVKDSQNSISFALPIHEIAFTIARKASPFERVSSLTGIKTETPLNAISCVEFINTHIRSDHKNQLLLRTEMTEADIQLIKDVARGDERDAVQALRMKIDREAIYKGRAVSLEDIA